MTETELFIGALINLILCIALITLIERNRGK